MTPDGAVYFGANEDPGNTDETAKFPSAVALIWRWTGDDAFRDEMYDFACATCDYIFDELDADGDGWPEGLGNVERQGMGEEKLDNTVYTIRGLRDLADLAASKGDTATRDLGGRQRRCDGAPFDAGLVVRPATPASTPTRSTTRATTKVFQRHWIGVTPMEAMLVRPGKATRPLAPRRATARGARSSANGPATPASSGCTTPAPGRRRLRAGNPGATCDSAVSTVAERAHVFSLNTAIMAVAEGNFGRLGADQQQYYTTGNARIQLDPQVWEMPGRDAGDRSRGRLHPQHRPAVHRALDGAAGLGRLRDPVAGRAPAARGLAGPRSRPVCGRAAAPERPAPRSPAGTSGWEPARST